MEILARELGISQLSITKNGKDSRLLTGYSKETEDFSYAVL